MTGKHRLELSESILSSLAVMMEIQFHSFSSIESSAFFLSSSSQAPLSCEEQVA